MKTNFCAPRALMLSLSLCGGLMTMAQAAPANGNPQTNPQTAAKTGKGKRGDKAGRGMKLMQELNLTDAQKAQLKPIMQDQKAQMKALKEDTTLTPEAKKAKFKALRAESEAKIDAILTPDQQKKLADLKAQHKAEMKAGGGDKGGKRGQNRQPLPPVPAT